MPFSRPIAPVRPLLSAALLTLSSASGLAQNPPPAVPVEPVEEAPLDAAAPDRIEGAAIALDGRTLLISATPVRLFGVEPGDGAVVDRLKARLALETLLAGKTLTCRPVDRDRDGIVRAVCEAGGADLAEDLIESGVGLPARLDSYAGSAPAGLGARYDAAEAKARTAGLGIWAALQPPSKRDDRPAWVPRWLWRIPTGLGALLGSLLGFLGLTIVAALLGRRKRRRSDRPA